MNASIHIDFHWRKFKCYRDQSTKYAQQQCILFEPVCPKQILSICSIDSTSDKVAVDTSATEQFCICSLPLLNRWKSETSISCLSACTQQNVEPSHPIPFRLKLLLLKCLIWLHRKFQWFILRWLVLVWLSFRHEQWNRCSTSLVCRSQLSLHARTKRSIYHTKYVSLDALVREMFRTTLILNRFQLATIWQNFRVCDAETEIVVRHSLDKSN